MLRALVKRPFALVATSGLSLLAVGVSFAEDNPVTLAGPYEPAPLKPECTKAGDASSPPAAIIGDTRPFPPAVVRVPAHIDSAELTSAEWGVIPGEYLDSWLQYGGGHFLWKRTREAPEGGELGAGTVNWMGADDGNQDLPTQKTNSAVALYKYTIKSSSEKTKTVKRFATATVDAEAGGAWASGSVNAKVGASIDTASDLSHNISEKVNITIEIKCASFKVTAAPTPETAILYFGPDSVKRDLPLPIKDADGKPKVIKWNPIVLDAAFSADNGATGGNAISCWYKYKGEIEKGEVTNTSWDVKKGVSAALGVQQGFRIWKFTADISVQGKAAGEWHDLDKTEFSKNAVGAWALNGQQDWRFPEPPTQKQRDDFQTPCKEDPANNAAACAAWDNIKAAYMSAVMKVRGVDGATEHGPNYRMVEWQNAMLTGSFRKVGDWLDSSNFFQLAELQRVGIECRVQGYGLRVYEAWWRSDVYYVASGPIFGLSDARCSVVDVMKPMDSTSKVGKLEISIVDKANTLRATKVNWMYRKGSKCGHKDWDWDTKYPYPYWYMAQGIQKAFENSPSAHAATDYVCFGCKQVGGASCDY